MAGVYRVSAGNAGGSRLIGSPIVYQQAIWSLGTTPGGELFTAECSLSGSSLSEGLAPEDALAEKLLARAGTKITSCSGY